MMMVVQKYEKIHQEQQNEWYTEAFSSIAWAIASTLN